MSLLNKSSLPLFLTLSLGAQAQATKQPNVIYVFPDQFRNHAMGFWNEKGFKEHVSFKADPVITPNLNKFAKQAVVLSTAQSNCPLSSPHRGMLFTGMYPEGSGVPLNCNSERPISTLREDATCMSDVFSQAGYNCAYFGKLHLNFPTPNDPENPGNYVEARRPAWDAYTPKERRHGFDFWYSYGTFDVHKQPHYWDNEGKRHEIREWSPKHEADKVISYLKNEGNVRDTSKPFFMMVSMNPPHNPYYSLDDIMEEDYNLYKDKSVDELLVRPNVNKKLAKTKHAAYYFGSVTGVDREFGRIMDALKEMGMEENTIVVFSSDHGETMCSQNTEDPKNSPYQESMNVPFMVRYPGNLQPRVSNLLISSPDIMPTVLGLAGLDQNIPQEVQGHDYSMHFKNPRNRMALPQSALYMRNLNGDKNEKGLVSSYIAISRGVKTHEYTLAIDIDKNGKIKKTYFFNDKKDPYQMKNLPFNPQGKVEKELLRQMASLLKQANDPWYKNRTLSEIIPYE